MKILIGSSVFFKEYSDFNPHDIDYVLFEERPQLYKIFAHINTKTEDVFAYKQMSKDEFLEYELEHCKKAKMAVGKLLVPELVKYMNILFQYDTCVKNDLKYLEKLYMILCEGYYE